MIAAGIACGLHRIERLMRLRGLRAHPRQRRLPPDAGERQAIAVAPNVLDRAFVAAAPNPVEQCVGQCSDGELLLLAEDRTNGAQDVPHTR